MPLFLFYLSEVNMIISSASDYREAARRRVPPFMFHYANSGYYAEQILARNVSDLEYIALRPVSFQSTAIAHQPITLLLEFCF